LTQNEEGIEGPAWSEDHRTAVGYYNSAAQFNATSLVAVVFGQFAILTLLKSTSSLPPTWQVAFLIFAYVSASFLGCYFIMNYLMFAQFIEELRTYAGVAPLERLEDYMTDKIKDRWVGLSWLRGKRRSVLRLRGLNLVACAGYVIISLIVLLASMYLPVPVN
jgi:hypothetical protein